MLTAVRSAPAAPGSVGGVLPSPSGLLPSPSLPADWQRLAEHQHRLREAAVLAAPDKPQGVLDAPWLAEASVKLAARSDRAQAQASGLDALFEALEAAGPLRSPSKPFGNPAFADEPRPKLSREYEDDTDCDVDVHGHDKPATHGPDGRAPRRIAAPPKPAGKKAREDGVGPQVAAAPRPPTVTHGARGAALRWTAEEDAELALAVSENRKTPDKRSLNGIQWAAIQRRAASDYPLLMRHLTSARGSKTCAKRWCQYLCPDDQANKNRKWR